MDDLAPDAPPIAHKRKPLPQDDDEEESPRKRPAPWKPALDSGWPRRGRGGGVPPARQGGDFQSGGPVASRGGRRGAGLMGRRGGVQNGWRGDGHADGATGSLASSSAWGSGMDVDEPALPTSHQQSPSAVSSGSNQPQSRAPSLAAPYTPSRSGSASHASVDAANNPDKASATGSTLEITDEMIARMCNPPSAPPVDQTFVDHLTDLLTRAVRLSDRIHRVEDELELRKRLQVRASSDVRTDDAEEGEIMRSPTPPSLQLSHTEQTLKQLKEQYAVILDHLASYPTAHRCPDEVVKEGLKSAQELLATAQEVSQRFEEQMRQQEDERIRREARRIRQEMARDVQDTTRECNSTMRVLLENGKHTASLTSALDDLDEKQRAMRRRLPVQRSRQVDDVILICVDCAMEKSAAQESVDGWVTRTKAELCETRRSVEDQLTRRVHAILEQMVFGK